MADSKPELVQTRVEDALATSCGSDSSGGLETLLTRHKLHQQRAAELVALAETVVDAHVNEEAVDLCSHELPQRMAELQEWHDSLVQELLAMVRDGEAKMRLKQEQLEW